MNSYGEQPPRIRRSERRAINQQIVIEQTASNPPNPPNPPNRNDAWKPRTPPVNTVKTTGSGKTVLIAVIVVVIIIMALADSGGSSTKSRSSSSYSSSSSTYQSPEERYDARYGAGEYRKDRQMMDSIRDSWPGN